MSRHTTNLLKSSLAALHYTGADRLMAPFARGVGAILMLHQVAPDPPVDFEPNRILRITPDFLDQTIRLVIESGFEVLSLDDMRARMIDGDFRRPFVVFTLDDAYKDNLVHAYPVFKRYGVPFTIYVPTDYADGRGELWWLTLQEAIRRLDHVELRVDGTLRTFSTTTAEEKDDAFRVIYWWLRSIDELEAREIVRDLAVRAEYAHADVCRSLILDWDELRRLASDPLVTLGAHTRRHLAVAKLSEAACRAEIQESVARLERELGKPCRHFSYPFGDETSAGPRDFRIVSELGLATAVTTRKGVVQSSDSQSLSALPRLSLNGDFQDARFVKVLLSGAPFALLNFARQMRASLRRT